MADFEVNINSRAFKNRGVRVNFDENRYGTLLDELVEEFPEDKSPIVNISPAPIWGMSRRGEFLAMMGRADEVFPQSQYNAGTQTLSVKVDKDADEANRLLLNSTRQWAGDMNGELAEQRAIDHEHRFSRRITAGGIIASWSVTGLVVAEGEGAFIGGVVGGVASIALGIANTRGQPYNQAIRQFVQDPQVLAEYGRILSYEAAPRS